MKKVALHHIHVKCGDDYFTISHSGDSISLGKLADIVTDIAQVCMIKFKKKGLKNEKI